MYPWLHDEHNVQSKQHYTRYIPITHSQPHNTYVLYNFTETFSTVEQSTLLSLYWVTHYQLAMTTFQSFLNGGTILYWEYIIPWHCVVLTYSLPNAQQHMYYSHTGDTYIQWIADSYSMFQSTNKGLARNNHILNHA